jgi:hypothetical protein
MIWASFTSLALFKHSFNICFSIFFTYESWHNPKDFFFVAIFTSFCANFFLTLASFSSHLIP